MGRQAGLQGLLAGVADHRHRGQRLHVRVPEAVAVAGFTSAVCKFTPLFMCNPFESTDDSLAYFTEQFDSTAEKRRIIALVKAGSGASYTPGNFGFLESELGPGAKSLAESLASVEPAACFTRG